MTEPERRAVGPRTLLGWLSHQREILECVGIPGWCGAKALRPVTSHQVVVRFDPARSDQDRFSTDRELADGDA